MASVEINDQDNQRKHLIFITSGNDRFMSELVTVSSPFYNAVPFAEKSRLFDELSVRLPKVLILDSTKTDTTAITFVSKIRAQYNSDQLPIVLTISPTKEDQIAEARKFPGVHILEKPFRPIQLFNVISQRINANIEASWNSIEPVQRSALKLTLKSYNSIANMIIDGAPIDYANLAQSCEPLVEAVQNHNYHEILRGLRDYDNYSYVHSMRVATFLSLFGDAIGIKGEDHMTLTTGGLLHDVGKQLIPYELLNKSGRLTENEFEIMKSHVAYSVDFLFHAKGLPKGVAIIAGQHHEKLDGTGYPHGLSGGQLNELARMATIIDIFGAMTDRRTYKESLPPEQALAEMAEMTGHLDHRLLTVFREMLLDSAERN
jgi:response regulator RpfG family c-di-GMP phosphodiesterase